jgi:PAS domain S-box-containing protein
MVEVSDSTPPRPSHATEEIARGDRFQQVVEGAPNAMVMVNAAGCIELFNAQAERMFGYSRAEIIGQPVEILIPGQFSRHHPGLRATFLENPAARPMGVGRDLYARRRDGTEFPVEIGLNPIQTDEGIMVLSSIVDISARKRLESRFRQVVEWAPSAMVMIDAQGRINMLNTQAEQIFGYTRDEILGSPMEILIPERLRNQHPRLRDAFFADPSSRPMGAGRELYARRKDGSEFPVEIGLNPIETEDGLLVLSAIIDISDRRQKEARLEAALQEKDILLSEIHHRVKNNLQIISSLLDLQAARIDDPGLRNVLRDSQNRIRSMTWIHQLLYQSHDFAQIDIGEVLDSLLPALMASYDTNPGQISLRIDAERLMLPLNQAIPCGLVINELIANALKHAFPDGRAGEIAVALKAVGDDSVALQVEDDGIGLPEGFRLADADSLGLQLVATLSKQLDGELTVARRGPTRFGLRFPRGEVCPMPPVVASDPRPVHIDQ